MSYYNYLSKRFHRFIGNSTFFPPKISGNFLFLSVDPFLSHSLAIVVLADILFDCRPVDMLLRADLYSQI